MVVKTTPGGGGPELREEFTVICCPEDAQTCGKHAPDRLCGNCQIPICVNCIQAFQRHSQAPVIPMGLCNDNLFGYITDVVYKYQVLDHI